MSSLSLRDQLLKAGLVNEQQVKEAERQAQRKALYAQIRELVMQNRIVRPDVEETYNFIDGGKVRRIRADAALRERIGRGEVMLVRCEGRYELVPPDIAEKIRERDARAVVAHTQPSAASEVVDEAYKDFVVPDDLMW